MGHGRTYSLEMVVLTCFINFYFINSLLQTLQRTIHCWPWIQATGERTSLGRLSVEWIHWVTLSKQISNTWNIHNLTSIHIHAPGHLFQTCGFALKICPCRIKVLIPDTMWWSAVLIHVSKKVIRATEAKSTKRLFLWKQRSKSCREMLYI